MNAYDIEIVNDAAHAGEANHGWCFGLPPGIRPEQWPLDPDTGYPLMHGFTLLLPEDYRVHGPEIVALSFFSSPRTRTTVDRPASTAFARCSSIRPRNRRPKRSCGRSGRPGAIAIRVCIGWRTSLAAPMR